MRRMSVCVSVLFALVIGTGVVYVTPCHAAVPGRTHYQGKLTDASGRLVSDGSYDIVFKLFDAPVAGDEKWSESHSGVQVTNGLFNVLLGETSDLTPVFQQNDALYLEIAVGGETLLPRQQVVSAGYALRAEKADDVKDGAITLDKLDTDTIPGLDSNGQIVPRVPVVNGISPENKDSGYSSFTATITGANFQSFSQARIGSINLTGEDVSSSSSMTATVPDGLSAGIHDVSVSSIDFVWGTGSGLFTVNTPTPTSTPTITSTATPTRTPTPIYASCKAWKDLGYNTDGLYWIDPDGGSTSNGFQAYCDMTTDGGGWTLVARLVRTGDQSIKSSAQAGGVLSSPAQGTSAKLSDETINQIKTNYYRMTCTDASTGKSYYDATVKPFKATVCGASNADVNRKSTQTYGGGWTDRFPGIDGHYCALDPYDGTSAPGFASYYRDDCTGCGTPNQQGGGEGYLYAK